MRQFVLMLAMASGFCSFASAAEPRSPLEKQLQIQQAIFEAKQYLTAGRPAEAAAAIEKILEQADGNAEVLSLLREAYLDELTKVKLKREPDQGRITKLQEQLSLINGKSAPVSPELPPIVTDTPVSVERVAKAEPTEKPNPVNELVGQATELFRQAKTQPTKFADAAKLFATAVNRKVELTTDQQAAWAYCRVKIATERWNSSQGDPATRAELVTEIQDALALAPNYAELQKAGQGIIASMGGQAKVAAKAAANPFTAKPAAEAKPAPTKSPEGWLMLESLNFRVRFMGSTDAAEELLNLAEDARAATFTKWSGPVAGAWEPKCEVMLHRTAAEYVAATKQPRESTGHAWVQTSGNRISARRIDLRVDDATHAEESLPREVANVVLSDLFPTQPPPRWAALGMAVLSSPSAEAERCARTLTRCYKNGELFTIAALLDLKNPPKPELVTGFYVESVSLVEHLVKKKGAKAFTMFVRDSQRYGTEKAMERQYGFATIRQLEDDWRTATLAAR